MSRTSEADHREGKQTPALRGWAERVGARQANFRRYVVEEEDEQGYKRPVAEARIKDGKFTCDSEEHAPTKDELEAIEAEINGANFPKSISATKAEARHKVAALDGDCFLFFDKTGEQVPFVQQRKYSENGEKFDLPWSFWNDGEWRVMEPEGPLPLYGLERLKDAHTIFLHEGAKTARDVQAVVNEGGAAHPWAEALSSATHLGWPGGVHRARDVDWSPIKKLPAHRRVVLICDNDQGGIDAATTISKLLQRPLMVVLFDDRFPPTFDLADKWPTPEKQKEWWKGDKYVGPSFDDCLFPATWATKIGNSSGKGRPPILVRGEFASEWLWVADPALFVHEKQTNRLLSEAAFNRSVRPFSDTEDTARLLTRHLSSKCDGVAYDPGQRPGLINRGALRLINTFRPSTIKATDGDAGPFLEFMRRLIPDSGDRTEMERWIATLIARPEIKMSYGVLLVSETQGVGKGTLGEAILTPLVGEWNASFPDERQITDSGFNGWIAHKRLAVVHEIYAGHSSKAYNKLKSVITDRTVTINEKFIKEYQLDVFVHVFACSNSTRALKLDDDDRRWLVPKVTEEHQPDSYWRDLHGWLRDGDGLGIIRRWADDWLRENEPVLKGQHAPTTARKRELIAEGRSDGYQLAFDLARSICSEKVKVVVAVEDVRYWVARERGLGVDDYRMERAATLLRAMKKGGLQAPANRPGESNRRFDITNKRGRKFKSYVAANFHIGADAHWQEIWEYYRELENLGNGPF